MTNKALQSLSEQGQSVWYDSIGRGLVREGGLQRLVDELAVVGVTSNPTIFEKAIAGSDEYDEDIRALTAGAVRGPELFERLATDDVRAACDVLRPIWEQTGHEDGRISIEVGPHLAALSEETMQAARTLWTVVDRPNLMVKIPGTAEGIPAIEQMIYEGLSINVTLLFDVARYEEVMEAYLRGLERRAAEGLPLGEIFSVASFFVSRVDTMVDAALDERSAASDDPAEQERLAALRGKAAIANAKLAYAAFQRHFSGARWEALRAQGANLQRPLWASTGTKNPAYPDTLYVTELVGPHTVNTMPDATLRAFADHGTVPGNTIEEDVEGARAVLAQLAEVGIELPTIAASLEEAGVRSFTTSYDQLLESIQQKAATLSALPAV